MPRARGRGRGKGRGTRSSAKAASANDSQEVADTSQEVADTSQEVADTSQEVADTSQEVADSSQEALDASVPTPDALPSGNQDLQSEAEASTIPKQDPPSEVAAPMARPTAAGDAPEPTEVVQPVPQAIEAQDQAPQPIVNKDDEPQPIETDQASHSEAQQPIDAAQSASEPIGAEQSDSQPPAVDDAKADDYTKLVNRGISVTVASEISNLIGSGVISYQELDEEALMCLKTFPAEKISDAIKEFSETDLTDIKNKGAHLVSILKAWQEDKTGQALAIGGPNEAKIKELLDRTGYGHEVTSGQRHYGPPANWEGDEPSHQAEVFVGKVPRDVFEDELVPLCEECGQLYEVRIMIDPHTGYNRGFAFVRFVQPEAAKAALEKLHDYEIRPGKKIKVNVSTPNLRLFVGNVPKAKSKEEIMEEFSKLTENLKDVIVYPSTSETDPERKNRGFCFLQYNSHNDAANAKRKLGRRGTRIFNNEIHVNWADPIDEDVNMAEVKILFVKNISPEVTEEELKEKFGGYGPLEKVKRLRDYAFVHFEEREHALKAIEELNGFDGLGKTPLDVSLARPVSDKAKQKREQRKMEQQRWGQRGGWQDFGRGGGYNLGWGGGHHVGAAWAPRPPVGNFFRGRGGGVGAPGFAAYGQPFYPGPSARGFAQRGGRGYGYAGPPAYGGPAGYGYGYGYGYGQGYGYGGGYGGGYGRSGYGRGGGGGGSWRGGGMKRKAQEAPNQSNGASAAKRERPEPPIGQQQAESGGPTDQDWTSDVAGNW